MVMQAVPVYRRFGFVATGEKVFRHADMSVPMKFIRRDSVSNAQ